MHACIHGKGKGRDVKGWGGNENSEGGRLWFISCRAGGRGYEVWGLRGWLYLAGERD